MEANIGSPPLPSDDSCRVSVHRSYDVPVTTIFLPLVVLVADPHVFRIRHLQHDIVLPQLRKTDRYEPIWTLDPMGPEELSALPRTGLTN